MLQGLARPYLGGFVNVLVGLRAEVQGLDHPFRWWGIHNGTAASTNTELGVVLQGWLDHTLVVLSMFL